MRLIAAVLFSCLLSAQSSEENAVIAVVQKLFDGMEKHDEAMIRSTMLPDARVYSVRGDGEPTAVSFDDWVKRIAGSKAWIFERFTSRPRVTVRGRMAQLWGEYEFHRDGQFSHCGVDVATLFKTAEGWKVATLGFTMETTGCKGR